MFFEDKELALKFGGEGLTLFHPLVFLVVILASFIILFGTKKRAITFYIFSLLLIPLVQHIVVLGINFTAQRILLLVFLLRLLLKEEWRIEDAQRIDKAMFLWGFVTITTYTFLWGTGGAFVNKVGYVLDSVGPYLIIRSSYTKSDDLEYITKIMIVFAAFLALLMVYEQFTSHNLLAFIGGLKYESFIRSGRVRSVGSFGHPILAGTYGAFLFPLAYYGVWSKKYYKFGVVGCLASVIVVLSSSSSGPVLALVSGIIFLGLWKYRQLSKSAIGFSLATLLLLNWVMKAPVWALIARVKVFGASTGYHRYVLIDSFIRNFKEWWLMGTKSTIDWHFGQTWDITNQYIYQGINGGVVTLGLFFYIILAAFNKSINISTDETHSQIQHRKAAWCLGAALFVHIVSFNSISYFDQTAFVYYFTLAAIANTFSEYYSSVKR